ncbi:UNVERIFIED_CONTAM: ATP-binding protein [Halobacillus marinus]
MKKSLWSNKRFILLSIIMYLLLALSLRVIWVIHHKSEEQAIPATAGEVDLSGWESEDSDRVILDGEWRFRPSLKQPSAFQEPSTGDIIDVPGEWEESITAPPSTPSKGIGTYALKIHMPEQTDEDQTFALRFSQIVTSALIYVNGEAIHNYNHFFSEEAPKYEGPVVVPLPQGEEEIELVVQVTNLHIPFRGGIIGAVEFGESASLFVQHDQYSYWQWFVALLYFLHAAYSLIAYFLSKRKRTEFLSGAVLLIVLGLPILIDDQVLLHLPVPIDDYYKILALVLMLSVIAFIRFMHDLFGFPKQYLIWYRFSTVLLAVSVCVTPFRYFPNVQFLVGIYLLGGLSFLFFQTIMKIRSGEGVYTFFLFSLISYVLNVLWGIGIKSNTTDFPLYPFDYILSIITLVLLLVCRYIRVEENNKVLERDLEQAERTKAKLLRDTTNELRQPLLTIANIADIVRTDTNQPLTTSNRENIDLVVNLVKFTENILDNISDMNEIKQKDLQLDTKPVDLNAVASVVVDIVQFQTFRDSIQFQVDIPPYFPPVLADEKRLFQILFNLIHNAMKFTDSGSIRMKAESRSGMAVITIEDTGVGMDRRSREHIFHPFEKNTDQSITRKEGLGLGLSITKDLIELHGGSIQVKSKEGSGSLFSFTLLFSKELQREGEQETAARVMQESPSTPTVQAPVSDVHILVVDNDHINRKIYKDLLSDYNITLASNGEEALQLLKSKRFDLLIIEVLMPSMSGYKLTQEIRKNYSIADLPILLLTARNRPEDVTASFLSGANDYVSKPVDAEELKARVRALIWLQVAIKEKMGLEAAWLQAQIKPHFLFNTLNTIISLNEHDNDKMLELMDRFSSYLRSSFNIQNVDVLVPIATELDLVESYLYIQSCRFGERLQVKWDISVNIQFQVPPFSIQTIVENALVHGILRQPSGGALTIQIRAKEEFYEVSIKDDGIGMTEETITAIKHQEPVASGGVGVYNTDKRLKQLFGTELIIESKEGKGTNVTMLIPKQTSTGNRGE